MDQPLRIGVIGDLDPNLSSHIATNKALEHAAKRLCVALDFEWLPTLPLEEKSSLKGLKTFDALWCAPGSPYESMRGALKSIRFAREKGWPFIGT